MALSLPSTSSLLSPLSLGGHVESQGSAKAMFLHGKPRSDANSVRGLLCKNEAFYSPETQHGRRVTKVYTLLLRAGPRNTR